MNNQMRLRRMLLLTFFIAVQVILTAGPLGFLYLGGVSITLVHIPVIVGACLLGVREGALLGFVFGLLSLVKASFTPDVSAFLFSPFVSTGGYSGNWTSLLVCFVPRIFFGWFAGILYHKVFRDKAVASVLSAFLATLLHTVSVLAMIYLFFARPFAGLMGIEEHLVIGALGAILTSNGIVEAATSTVLVPAILKALTIVRRKMTF